MRATDPGQGLARGLAWIGAFISLGAGAAQERLALNTTRPPVAPIHCVAD